MVKFCKINGSFQINSFLNIFFASFFRRKIADIENKALNDRNKNSTIDAIFSLFNVICLSLNSFLNSAKRFQTRKNIDGFILFLQNIQRAVRIASKLDLFEDDDEMVTLIHLICYEVRQSHEINNFLVEKFDRKN